MQPLRLNRSQDEIRRWFDVSHDSAGNLHPRPGIFPDQMAPVVLASKEGGGAEAATSAA